MASIPGHRKCRVQVLASEYIHNSLGMCPFQWRKSAGSVSKYFSLRHTEFKTEDGPQLKDFDWVGWFYRHKKGRRPCTRQQAAAIYCIWITQTTITSVHLTWSLLHVSLA